MGAFRVHVKPLESEDGICRQDPHVEFLEKMQRRPNNTELFRCSQPFF